MTTDVADWLPEEAMAEDMINNEHTWRIRRGAMAFVADDGDLWNRFELDKCTGATVEYQ